MAAFARARLCCSGLRASLCCSAWQLLLWLWFVNLNKDTIIIINDTIVLQMVYNDDDDDDDDYDDMSWLLYDVVQP